MGGKLEERPLNCGQKGTKHVTQTLGSLGSKVAVPHGGPICGYGAMGGHGGLQTLVLPPALMRAQAEDWIVVLSSPRTHLLWYYSFHPPTLPILSHFPLPL